MIYTRRRYLTLLGAGYAIAAHGQPQSLVSQWQDIASSTDGIVGVAALHLTSGEFVSVNGTDHFPLASVCKFPIALRVLTMVDAGLLKGNEDIEVLPRDVLPSWNGDLASRWPSQSTWNLNELVRVMLSESDNTAVQTLFRLGGEERGMNASLRHWQINGIRVDRYEGQCMLASHGVPNAPPVAKWTPGIVKELIAQVPLNKQHAAMQQFLTDPRDTATPQATVQLLARAFRGELLSSGSTARLIADMKACATGQQRLKGLLPPGTIVAHKTGTTDTIAGLNAATNDMGVISLPNKKGHLAIAVYLKGSTRDDASRDRVIARLARTAYDHWTAS